MLQSSKSTNFLQIFYFSLLKKWLRGPDEIASRPDLARGQ